MPQLFDILKDTSEDQMETFSQYITATQRKGNILGEAILQLTPLCNLSCKMCYARMTKDEVKSLGKDILRFEEWKWYIDRFKEIGTTLISFTGGECMVHPDFEQIYNYAYDRGFRILLMTNAAHMSDGLFNLFCNKPPERFSITVYGGSPETYCTLCGSSKAYNNVFYNIDRLKNKGFNILVKYTVTSDNIDDLPRVYEYFRQRGIRLRYQNTLMRFNKANNDIVKEETVDESRYLEAEKAIYGNAVHEENVEKYKQYVKNMRERFNLPDKGIRCSAGRNVCYIRWDGLMTPCVSFDCITVDPKLIGLEAAWKKLNEWAAEYPAMKECDRCLHATRCLLCASLHYNDTHKPGVPAPRLCWKRNHPDEARAIEKQLIENGLIAKEEVCEYDDSF